MSALDDVALEAPDLAAMLKTGGVVGFGFPQQLAAEKPMVGLQWKNDTFILIRQDRTLGGVFATWRATLSAMSSLRS